MHAKDEPPNRLRIGLLLAPAVVFFATVGVAVWRAADAFCFHHEDLGIYSEAIARISLASWNPYLTARGIRIFNDHFDPIVLLVAPLRRFVAPWQAAILGEQIFIALACVPCIWIAARRRLDAHTSFLIGALLVFEPAVLRAVRFPVHPTTWAMAPMMLVVAALLEKKTAWLLCGLILLFSCKEEFPFFGLALGIALIATKERRAGYCVVALSALWITFAFVAREMLMGETSAYGASIFAGLFDNPAEYLTRRLETNGLGSGLWDFVAPLLPIIVFATLKRSGLPWVLIFAAAPLVAIRFFGMAWKHHYLAPLVPIAIGIVVHVASQAKIPKWCSVAVVAIMAALDFSSFRFVASRWSPTVAAAPLHCPPLPARMSQLNAASALLVTEKAGNVLVEGNLFTKLAERDHVYAIGNFQPPPQHYRYIFLEKPTNGDPYPHNYAWIDTLFDEVRQSTPNALIDNDYVFLAEGDFVF